MNQKSLSVKNKTHKKILRYLKDKKILKIFKEFEKSLKIKSKFAVAVSGGPDSLSLAFLSKCISLKHKIPVRFYIVNHKLRKESSSEAKIVSNILRKIDVNCKILNWHGPKPSTNIQSIARDKRYDLLFRECKKENIKYLLLGHHLDDLFENFLIRILRGSGLKGLVSLNKNLNNKINNIEILRPLLDFEKKNLIYLSHKIFNFFILDPSNQNENFKRIRIRSLLQNLEKEGLDKKKFLLTINNLKNSNETIKFYVNKNINENSVYLKTKKTYILNKSFFKQSHEVIFRSLTDLIQFIGKKYYPVRGKSINNLISKIKSEIFLKVTIGSCIVEKINQSILIYKEK